MMSHMLVETVGILVPSDRIGRVIGSGGSGLKRMREAGGCKIQVDSSEDPYSAAFRRVDLNGTIEACVAAFAIMAEPAFNNEGESYMIGNSALGGTIAPMVVVPSTCIGRVIGKGGDNLKKIREQFGVHVAPEREDASNPTTKNPERVITLTGNLDRTPDALRCIMASAVDSSKKQEGPPIAMGGGAYGHGGGAMPMGGYGGGGMLGAPYPGVAGGPGAPMGSGLRLQTIGAGEVQLHLHVPDKFVGAIVGKAGARVKQTALEAGCKISMTNRDACPDRRVVIIGTMQQCAKAQEIVHGQILEAAEAAGQQIGDITVTFFVPKDSASAVIGKQASTLKTIRESCNIKVNFGRDEVCGHRPCTITGALEGVLQAEHQVHDKVSNPAAAAPAEGIEVPPGFN